MVFNRLCGASLPVVAVVGLAGILAGCAMTPEPATSRPRANLPTPAVAVESPFDAAQRLLLAGDGVEAERRLREILTGDAAEDEKGWARLGIGDALTLQSRWREALAIYTEAAEGLGSTVAGTAAQARREWLEAKRSLNGADPQSGRPLLEKALTTARRQDDAWLALRVQITTMDVDLVSEDPAASLPALQAARADLERQAREEPETLDRAGYADLLRALGLLHLELGRLDEAGEILTRSVEAYEDQPNGGLKSRAWQDLAIYHAHRRDMGGALRAFRQATEVAEGLPRLQAHILGNIGAIYASQGNFILAEQAMKQCLAAFESTDNVRGTLNALHNLGALYTSFHYPDRARSYMERSLPLMEQVAGPLEIAGAWLNVGRLELDQGRLDEAEAAFRTSAELSASEPRREQLGLAQAGLARVLLQRGQPLEALALSEPLSQSARPDLAVMGHSLTGQALRALGRLGEAEGSLRRALSEIEEQMLQVAGGGQGQELFLELSFAPYGELIDLLAEADKVTSALSFAERIKAKSLLVALGEYGEEPTPAGENADADGSTRASLIQRLALLNQEILRHPQDDDAHAAERDRLIAERNRVRLELETLNDLKHSPARSLRLIPINFTLRIESVLASLPPGTAILEFQILDDKVLLFTLRADENLAQARVTEVGITARELRTLTEDLRTRLPERNEAYRFAARRLYDRLIAPIEERIAGQRLAVVPDGSLWDVPLGVFEGPTGETLADRFDLFVTPSLSYLAVLQELRFMERDRPAPADSLLAVGNPTWSTEAAQWASDLRGFGALGALPDAEQEVKEIARLHDGETRVLVGAAATEGQIKRAAGRYRTVHFATHALLDDHNPTFSTLVLAPDTEGDEDGLLESWEIADLDLDADLVVLAGCQTLRGRQTRTSGMMGLAWAFAAAGTPAVIASYWEVDSRATRRLMVAFHTHLSGGADPAAALRRAAGELRRDPLYTHPFYWAGFTLVGDPGGVR